MNYLKEWFNEIDRKYSTLDSTFVIYKGFKIIKSESNYSILDVRVNDFYKKVKKQDLKILKQKGFIKGADYITYLRNVKRVEIYTQLIERLYTDRDKAEANLKEDIPFYSKKIRNCNSNILVNIDMMFFYKSKIEQYENKYNLIKDE